MDPDRVNGTKIRELAADQRPRERLLAQGAAGLSDAELLAVLLRTGVAGTSAIQLAFGILKELGGLSGLRDRDLAVLDRPGLGPAKLAAILAAIELGRRLSRASLPDRLEVDRPASVADYLAMRYMRSDQEVMGALYLDSRNRLIRESELFRGTLNRASAEPRLVLKRALYSDAAAVLLFHTHPSGDPSPSAEDLAFTQRMVAAGEVVGVPLLDHLILGGGGRWVSLKAQGAW